MQQGRFLPRRRQVFKKNNISEKGRRLIWCGLARRTHQLTWSSEWRSGYSIYFVRNNGEDEFIRSINEEKKKKHETSSRNFVRDFFLFSPFLVIDGMFVWLQVIYSSKAHDPFARMPTFALGTRCICNKTKIEWWSTKFGFVALQTSKKKKKKRQKNFDSWITWTFRLWNHHEIIFKKSWFLFAWKSCFLFSRRHSYKMATYHVHH